MRKSARQENTFTSTTNLLYLNPKSLARVLVYLELLHKTETIHLYFVKNLGMIANLITTVFTIIYIISFDREPQNFVVLLSLICISVLSIKFDESPSKAEKTA